MMAEYTPGRAGSTVTGGRDQRLAAMLAKWPVLAEEWAQGLERRRTLPAGEAHVTPAAHIAGRSDAD